MTPTKTWRDRRVTQRAAHRPRYANERLETRHDLELEKDNLGGALEQIQPWWNGDVLPQFTGAPTT